MTNQGKLLTNIKYPDLWFVKSLPWLFNRNLLTEIKISFYRNIAIFLSSKCLVWIRPNAGVGNYFRPRATLLLHYCLAGHISVKKAKSKLKKLAFAGRMWPAGRMLPPPDLTGRGGSQTDCSLVGLV